MMAFAQAEQTDLIICEKAVNKTCIYDEMLINPGTV
jgi:hypothetical protein